MREPSRYPEARPWSRKVRRISSLAAESRTTNARTAFQGSRQMRRNRETSYRASSASNGDLPVKKSVSNPPGGAFYQSTEASRSHIQLNQRRLPVRAHVLTLVVPGRQVKGMPAAPAPAIRPHSHQAAAAGADTERRRRYRHIR